MSSKALQIRNELVGVISGIQKGGQPAFTEVRGYPYGRFDSYPSARVLPGDQQTEKAAFGQNDRTVSFTIRTHLPLNTEGQGAEFDQMYELTDLILDTLDAKDFANNLNIGTYILNATRGEWAMEGDQDGVDLTCDVYVEVKYSKDNF